MCVCFSTPFTYPLFSYIGGMGGNFLFFPSFSLFLSQFLRYFFSLIKTRGEEERFLNTKDLLTLLRKAWQNNHNLRTTKTIKNNYKRATIAVPRLLKNFTNIYCLITYPAYHLHRPPLVTKNIILLFVILRRPSNSRGTQCFHHHSCLLLALW